MTKTTKLSARFGILAASVAFGTLLASSASAQNAAVNNNIPNAKPGECYARVTTPAQTRTVSDQVLKTAGSERVEIVPARYEAVEERILVKAASKRIEVIPATFETIDERIMVKPASSRLEVIPAQYENVTEQVLERAAYTTWKKGNVQGSKATALDAETGEVMCLVEVPASYKTVTKRVLKSPETTRAIEIPAEYKMVKKTVMKTPPTTREIEIPAEYGTVTVQKVAAPATERKIQIPAEYQTVTRTEQVSAGSTEWRSILCETNATKEKISEVQANLKKQGFYNGPLDGVFGSATTASITAFQKAKNLPVDTGNYMNMATVRALGL